MLDERAQELIAIDWILTADAIDLFGFLVNATYNFLMLITVGCNSILQITSY